MLLHSPLILLHVEIMVITGAIPVFIVCYNVYIFVAICSFQLLQIGLRLDQNLVRLTSAKKMQLGNKK
jgi:hypothetical protein